MNTLKAYYSLHPLRTILFAGLVFRLLAAVFSKGFGWIDDQFLVIEIAQSWVSGTDYYHWLPAVGNSQPAGFSFFYPGLHFVLFTFLDWTPINDPQVKMLFVRLIHALWSMLTVYFGYRVARHFSDKKTALQTGWILALLWFFPFLSVHNLVEFFSVPFVLWGLYLILKNEKKENASSLLIAGILLGIAFNVRFQTLLLTGGIGLVLFIEKKWKQAFLVATGVLISILLVQGIVDWVIWGKPFSQLSKYVLYNATHSGEYTSGPWYVYLLFILGMLIPPVSLFFITGYFYNWRKLLIIFLPTFIFLLFHALYPNKQERFITTIIPFLIISGLLGWHRFLKKNMNLAKINRNSWVFFWILNSLLLLPVSVMYSKKARVESMVYLSRYENLQYFVIEDVNKDVLRFPPLFYLEKYIPYDAVMHKDNLKSVATSKNWKDTENQPGFVLFYEPKNLEKRVDSMKLVLPELVFEKLVVPGYLDRVLHWLNPVNDNQNIYIYRNKAVIPDAIILKDE